MSILRVVLDLLFRNILEVILEWMNKPTKVEQAEAYLEENPYNPYLDDVLAKYGSLRDGQTSGESNSPASAGNKGNDPARSG